MNRIETPLAVGDWTRNNTVGSGRKKPRHTSRYPSASRRLLLGMSTVLVIAETWTTNFYPDQRNFRGLIREGPPATGPNHSCGQAETAAVEGIDR